MKTYHVASPAAILGGVAAAGGAIALLVRDALSTGWTVDLALMPLLVGLTILCGHHSGKAFWRGKVIAAVGLAFLAVFGSSLIVYETMGRRAEVRDAKVASATDSASQRQHLQKMLAEAEENVTRYRTRLSDECGSGKGKKCDGYAYTVKTWEAAVTGYKAEISGLGAPKPIDPKAERITAVVGMLGVGIAPEAIQRHVALLEPLTLPLFLELGSIVLFGYGLGRGRRREVTAPATTVKALTFEKPLTPDEIEELRRLILGAGKPLSNQEVADALGISKGEASKRVSEGVARGILNKQRVGREVAISTIH